MMLTRLPALLALAVLLAFPPMTLAENVVTRTGAAVGGFFTKVGDALFGGLEGEDLLEGALESYANGHFFTTVLAARRLRVEGDPELHDEADLLVGIAGTPSGLVDEGGERLRAVLDREPLSPYYPLALAKILDLYEKSGRTGEAADVAERYFARLWAAPRTQREAQIKGLFLEQGALTASEVPRVVTVADLGDEPLRRTTRPADRAVYAAGQVLLVAGRYQAALTCFGAMAPHNTYYAYARYGQAQASYALGNFREARSFLSQVHSFPAQVPGEFYLKDRAALLLGRLHHELDENRRAINWLRTISEDGPFAFQASLLSAEIHASAGEPALALAYLDDGVAAAIEPKLEARGALLRAQLELAVGDSRTAVERLRVALRDLDRYARRVERAIEGSALETSLLPLLERRFAARAAEARWRRANLANAVPVLIDYRPSSGWLSGQLVAWSRGEDSGPHPVVYYEKAFDPFTAIPSPDQIPFDPPADSVLSAIFRHALSTEVTFVFEHERRLRDVLAGAPDTELAPLLAETEAWLRVASRSRSVSDLEWVRDVGLSATVEEALREGRSPAVVASLALESGRFSALDRSRHAILAGVARRQLGQWAGLKRRVVAEAAKDELREVGQIRYELEVGLTDALEARRRETRSALRSP